MSSSKECDNHNKKLTRDYERINKQTKNLPNEANPEGASIDIQTQISDFETTYEMYKLELVELPQELKKTHRKLARVHGRHLTEVKELLEVAIQNIDRDALMGGAKTGPNLDGQDAQAHLDHAVGIAEDTTATAQNILTITQDALELGMSAQEKLKQQNDTLEAVLNETISVGVNIRDGGKIMKRILRRQVSSPAFACITFLLVAAIVAVLAGAIMSGDTESFEEDVNSLV